jgi:protein involved in polysaccharide export with SLBB domain
MWPKTYIKSFCLLATGITLLPVFVCEIAQAQGVSPAANSTPATLATQANTNTPAAPRIPEPPNDQQRLASGDRVSFRVIEDREAEPKLLIVADSGELEVPYIGRVMARERTCKEVAGEIKEKLEQKYYHRATVVLGIDLLNRTRGTVYLFGEVRSSGSLAMPSEETLTLAKAIIRAGGLTDFADKKHVKVTREATVLGRSGHVFIVDIGRVLEKGQLEHDLKLEPGDMIYVPGRLINF